MNSQWTDDLRALFAPKPPAAPSSGGMKAPEGLLDDIKREMARRGSPMISARPASAPATTSMPSRRWRAAAAVAAIALLLGGGVAVDLWLGKEITPQTENATAIAPGSDSSAKIDSYSESVEPAAEAERAADIAPLTASASTSSTPQRVTKYSERNLATAQESDKNVGKDSAPAEGQESGESAEKKSLSTQEERTGERNYIAQRHSRSITPRRKQRQNAWSIGAHYGGGSNSSASESGEQMTFMAATLFGLSGSGQGSSVEEGLFLSNAMVTQTTTTHKEKHHRPFRVGLSLRFRIDDRWSLQSGLTYSRLRSEFSESSLYHRNETTQKLNYIGIPLSLSYSIWRSRHLNLYVTSGGEVEKLVKGQTSLYGFTETIQENAPVWSVLGATGFEYQANNRFSLFVEPGASYHFDNGSPIESAYTDQPFDFRLNFGIRIDLR